MRKIEIIRNSIVMPFKKKVAAYARVSTDMEEQATSYEAQLVELYK